MPLEPTEYTNVDQAAVYAREYKQKVRYSNATSFIFFNGKYWKEDALKVHKITQVLTQRQLDEINEALAESSLQMQLNNINETVKRNGEKKLL